MLTASNIITVSIICSSSVFFFCPLSVAVRARLSNQTIIEHFYWEDNPGFSIEFVLLCGTIVFGQTLAEDIGFDRQEHPIIYYPRKQ